MTQTAEKQTNDMPVFPVSNVSVLANPEQLEQLTIAEKMLERATNYAIDSDTSLEIAAAELRTIKTQFKKTEEQRKTITTPLLSAKKQIDDYFRPYLDALKESENLMKKHILVYNQKQDQIRREKQRQLEEEARKQREKLEAEAAKAEQQGEAEHAEDLRDQAVTTIAPVAPKTEQPKGVSYRTVYRAEVTDIKALLAAVLEDKVPANVVSIDMKILNQLARTLKDQLRYPGVKVIEDKTVAAR